RRGRSGRRPRRRRATRGPRSAAQRSRSQDPELLQLSDRLEERARADRVAERRARLRAARGGRFALAPAERADAELERAPRRAQRLLLAPEDRGGEQVQEAVLAVRRRIRVMQPRRRLEDEPAAAAPAHERCDLVDRRNTCAAAADLGLALDVLDVAL